MTAGAARNHAAIEVRPSLVDELVAGLSASIPTFVSAPAPLVPIEHAAAAIDGFGTVLESVSGDAVVAFGAYATLPDSATSAELETLLRSFARRPTALAPFATFAIPFDPARDGSAPAEGFVVPRVAYVVRKGRAHLAAVGTSADAESLRGELTRVVSRLGEPVRSLSTRVDSIVDRDDTRFRASVAAALPRITSGEVAKVVLARRFRARLHGPARVESLLAALGRRSPGTHRFARVRGPVIFVGATPERLVTCRDGVVSTEALAGTKRHGRSDELVSSSKDRAEQRWVQGAIREALAPYVDPIRIDAEPSPRELRDLVHLATNFDGPLRPGASAIDVVRALHPTPAVGGVPRDRAVALLREAEPFDRALYAAPFGWVDAQGDADVVVALRCGRFEGEVADLFAGAGIVEGSDPDLELEETDLKLRALLSVLDGDAE